MKKDSFKLSDHEKRVLLPLVVQMLKHRGTKTKVFSNTKIRKILKEFGEVTTEPQIKRIIYHIRVSNTVECLVANSKGYFVAENINDVLMWIKMQQSKITAMNETLDSIQKQYWKNKKDMKLGTIGCMMGQVSLFDVLEEQE